MGENIIRLWILKKLTNMKIKQLFNYRPDGKDIILNDGETKVMVIV